MAFEQVHVLLYGRKKADVAGEGSHLIAVIDEILASAEAEQGPTTGYKTASALIDYNRPIQHKSNISVFPVLDLICLNVVCKSGGGSWFLDNLVGIWSKSNVACTCQEKKKKKEKELKMEYSKVELMQEMLLFTV